MSTNQTNVNSFNRARRDYHAVGKCIPKKDSSQLLLGKPVFTDDITPRDALVIKLLRSPYANAIVEDVKTDIALKVPGMVAVYTWEDVPKKRFSIAGQTFPEPSPYDRLILARHVRSVGDAVAIVVGESEKAVDKALNMIKVKYTILEPVLDFRKSLDNKVLVHPEDDWSSSIDTGDVKRNLIHHEEDEHGNVEKILSECDEIIEHTYRIKAAQQAYMETCRAYCEIDRYGRLHCISSTQIVFHLRRILSNALDIPKSMVRAEKPRIGGGFGAKQTAVCEVYPAFVTWKTKRPSKIIYSRKECQTIASPRHEMEVTVRLGAMRDGHIRAIDLYTLSNGGAYGEHSTTTVGLSGHKSLPLYTGGCEATRFSCDVVYTNVQAAGAYRGYGATQGIFALESTVNELAEKLHIDPVELRLKNIVREGMFMPAYFGETANACALDRCIMHCADNFHWADKYPVRDMGNGKVRAAGMALAMQGSCISNVDVGSCTLKLSDCGTYNMMIGAADMGTGCDTVMAQIAADCLNTPMDNIVVFSVDTDISPYDSGSYASATTYTTGVAVMKACEELKKKICKLGAEMMEVDEGKVDFDGSCVFYDETLEISDGADGNAAGHMTDAEEGYSVDMDAISSENAQKKVSLEDIALKSTFFNNIELQVVKQHSSPISPPPFMVGMAEVEVDTETGSVDVLDYVAVVDCGTPINPNLARVQTEGGIAQGIGMALWEDVQYTDKGKIRNNSFMQYKIPTRQDIGNIRVDFECSYEKSGPFGAKSIGELVIDTPCPALAEAIYNATGVRLTELPMTPEKIAMEILKNRESTRSGTKVEE